MKTPGTGYYGQQGGGARRQTNASEASPDSRIYIPSITSQEILDENAQSRVGKHRFTGDYPNEQRRGKGMNRKVLVIAVVVVVAIVGAVVAYVATKGGSSNDASNQSGGAGSSNSTSSGTDSSKSTTSKPSTSGSSKDSSSSTTKKDGNAKVRTDPTTETFSLSAFAIGDWGQTIAQNDSCCQRRKGKFNGYDWNAEAGVAKLMDLESTSNKPAVVLSHGDNFYWTGIDGKNDQAYRFEQTFESRHKVEAMGDVPWINVMGNHDYGGGSYICRDSDEQLAKCSSKAALLSALEDRFTLQSTYKSPNSDRWVLTDHFYKYSLKKGDVTMDIFNLDMNDAESHGANEICCQCYSYAEGNSTICKTVTRGDENCCGGDSDMYDGCVGKFKEWGQEAMTKLVEGVKASKATWKIVNSHYSPYGHYGETTGSKWLKTLDGLGVQLWIAGHTHGTKHDFGSFATHFVENGAGGGIQSESASGIPPYATALKNVWTAPGYSDGGNEYGFFTLQASSNWLKLRFLTFDDNWSLKASGSSLGSSKIGGVKEGYCYYIPSDGDEGKTC